MIDLNDRETKTEKQGAPPTVEAGPGLSKEPGT